MNELIYKRNKILTEEHLPFDVEIKDVEATVIKDVEVLKAFNGSVTARIKFDGKEKYLHSKYSPEEEAAKLADQVKIEASNYFVCFGFGFGYYIKAILERLNKTDVLIVVEPNADIFKYAFSNIDLIEFYNDKRLNILVGIDTNSFVDNLALRVSWANIHKIKILTAHLYDEMFLEEYRTFLRILQKEQLQLTIEANTLTHFSRAWNANFYKNFKFVLDSYDINRLYNKFTNKPIIVVAAGPSLSKNMHLLKEIQGKVVIVCVYTAYKVLLDNGIIPDFTFSLDSNQLPHDVTNDKTTLIFVSHGNTGLIESHKGRRMDAFIFPEMGLINLFRQLEVDILPMISAGSVAHSALDFAVKLGGDPVVLIGQDLAFTDNRTHVRGSFFDNEEFNNARENELEIEDVYGNKVFTSTAMFSYKLWFERYITNHAAHIKVIDATEGGAKIDGTEIMTLREVIDTYCKDINDDVVGILEEQYAKGKLLTIDQTRKVHDILIETIKTYDKAIFDIKEAVDACKRLERLHVHSSLTPKEARQNAKYLQKLTDVDKKINGLKETLAWIFFVLEPTIFKLTNEELPSTGNANLDIVKKSTHFYTGLLPVFEEANQLLEGTVKDVKDFLNKA